MEGEGPFRKVDGRDAGVRCAKDFGAEGLLRDLLLGSDETDMDFVGGLYAFRVRQRSRYFPRPVHSSLIAPS